MFLSCVLARFAATLRGSLVWIGASLVGLAIGLVIAFLTGNWYLFGIFALILGALVVSAIITALTLDVVSCAIRGR